MKKLRVPFTIVLVFAAYSVFAQYYVYDEISLPDTSITTDAIPLYNGFMLEDVKAVGMGKTHLANGKGFNAMMYNPALLTNRKFTFDLLKAGFNLPVKTLKTFSWIQDNSDQFKSGGFLNDLNQGFKEYDLAQTPQGKIEAIRKIREALKFPDELIKETVGAQNDPNIHGIQIVPSFQMQYENWGFTLFSNVQTGFQVSPGNSINELLTLNIPEGAESLDLAAARKLEGVLSTLFDDQGNLANEALPQIFALSYIDIVAALGYGYDYSDELKLGANLKVINRRLSAKNIEKDNISNLSSSLREDFSASITGVTADIGATYQYRETGTSFALTIQNLIPVQTISSDADLSFVNSEEYYYTDSNGDPLVGYINPTDGSFIPDAAGDTMIFSESQKIKAIVPVELKVPTMVNIGFSHPIQENWDVTAEVVDLFKSNQIYESYSERFRIGTEFRMLNDMVALRGGLADKNLTLGAGLNIKVLQLDAAYAYDNFIGDNAYFIQLKLGW